VSQWLELEFGGVGLSAQGGQTQPSVIPGEHGPHSGSRESGAGGVDPSLAAAFIATLSFYLPSDTLLILYYSLVHSHLIYALPLWGATYKTCLIKLKKTSK